MIVDGGNSNFRDSQRRYAEREGAGHPVRRLRRLGRHLGPGGRLLPDGRRRRRAVAAGRAGLPRRSRPRTATRTSAPSGAGHFTKMVHNGIEYGLMQAYAEGFEMMESRSSTSTCTRSPASGGTAPSSAPGCSSCCTRRSRRRAASSRRSAATSRTPARAAGRSPRRSPRTCPVPVITAALFARFASRQDESFAAKVNAALRNQFGGHAVKRSRPRSVDRIRGRRRRRTRCSKGCALRRAARPVHPRHLRRLRRPRPRRS